MYRTNSDKTCIQTFLREGKGREREGQDTGRRFKMKKLEVSPNLAPLPLAFEPFGLCNNNDIYAFRLMTS